MEATGGTVELRVSGKHERVEVTHKANELW